jgi:hypothetical protein
MKHQGAICIFLLLLTLLLAACSGAAAEDSDGDEAPPEPPPAPTSTPEQRGSQEESGLQTIYQQADLYNIVADAHPHGNWAAVGIGTRVFDDPIRGFFRVYNPVGNAWGKLQNVDIGETVNGDDQYASHHPAIADDGTVHVIWGPADETGGTYHARSYDFGETWTSPVMVTDNCLPLDFDVSRGGYAVIFARCGYPFTFHFFVYTPQDSEGQDWEWVQHDALQPAQPSYVDVEIIDMPDGSARAVTLSTVWNVSNALMLGTMDLPDGTPTWHETEYPEGAVPLWGWRGGGHSYIRTRYNPVTVPPEEPGGEPTTELDAQFFPSATFVWAGFNRRAIYAIHTFDAGNSWTPVELVAGGEEVEESPMVYPGVVYDPATDTLSVIYTEGSGGIYGSDMTTEADRTHFHTWRHLDGGGSWSTPTQLALGGLQIRVSRTAQSYNSRIFWLIWTEDDNRVRGRTVHLRDLLPEAAYPEDTNLPPSPPEPW